MPLSAQVTTLVGELRGGDRGAADRLMALVYPELRKIARQYMRRERASHTLQATALVHEVYLRLVGSEPADWRDRAHFVAAASRKMRQILVDHARRAGAQKRGRIKLSLEEAQGLVQTGEHDVVVLHDALTCLEQLDPQAGRVVELRFFGGLTEKETAAVLGLSLSTIRRDWHFARAWLLNHLAGA